MHKMKSTKLDNILLGKNQDSGILTDADKGFFSITINGTRTWPKGIYFPVEEWGAPRNDYSICTVDGWLHIPSRYG